MRRTSKWSVVVQIVSAIIPCYTILILTSSHGCYARDTITRNSSLVDGKTLVSAGNRFELGFFPSRNSNRRYVGIWYTSSRQTVVWVANRGAPLCDKSGVLSIAANGSLTLSDGKGKVYWSTQLMHRPRLDTVAKLHDTGNFVLFDNWLKENLWQSFDEPTDTFLFGMNILDENFALTSWTSEEDPRPGSFTFKQNPDRKNRLVVKKRSIAYWISSRTKSGKWDAMPSTLVNFLNLSWNIGVNNNEEKGINFTVSRRTYDNERLVMNFTGDLQYWQLDTEINTWSLIWMEPKNKCDVFNFCGNFGTCNDNNIMLPCKCLPGFKPKFPEKWNAGKFLDGCSRNSSLSCGNDYFLRLKRVKVEYSESPYVVEDEKDCREECRNNCQCQAYSIVRNQEGSGIRSSGDYTISCFTWTRELKNLQEDQDDGYDDLYIRVARPDIESTARNCDTCGTNLVPYPLSTGPKCGDAMYFSFYCKNDTYQLSFMAPSGNYNVISVNPEKRIFIIQMPAEKENCKAMLSSGSKILQLNQSLPFNVTSWCNHSSLNGAVEVEISWKPPLEPTCVSSADCKDWPNSSCNKTGNVQKRCLCNTKFRWDGSALNCTGGGQSGESLNKNKPLHLILGVSVPIVMVFFCAIVSLYTWRKRVVKRRAKQRKAILHRYDTEKGVKELIDSGPFEKKDGTGIDVPFFDFESILVATDNFSEENKLGKGGFGPVYKGKFPGGQEIAVKRLSSVSGQGLDEFKNEVVLIAKLQHRNLVRLLGYCVKGEEKILLYEYMPNKSLDSLVFDEPFSQQLDWETRFNIILGIARGLLYLHQDSRLRIIHRDLKTSNILLDAEMNPKISDFGLARMIQGKQTEGNTLRVVGTYGYMAPEYALDGLFSVKSDVFSFGVVMLEIVSGKKNMRFYRVENAPSLIGYAWRLWQEGKALDLMDETLRSSCNESELLRCVHVGLLCVQEDPSDRPTMSNVVVLLGSETVSLPIPKQPAFLTRRTVSTTASTSSKAETNTEITATLEGR
ncbi:hypothetical protein PTKIN_Ptkin07bG0023300 [Pterospermum kingtungense]